MHVEGPSYLGTEAGPSGPAWQSASQFCIIMQKSSKIDSAIVVEVSFEIVLTRLSNRKTVSCPAAVPAADASTIPCGYSKKARTFWHCSLAKVISSPPNNRAIYSKGQGVGLAGGYSCEIVSWRGRTVSEVCWNRT
jgi:hypothetical protein